MKNNLILGGLFGVACGDALGGPLEFMNKKEIQHKHGYVKDFIGGGWLNLQPGEITDDTMMTLAVAKGILDNPQNPIPEIGKYFMDWYKSKPKDIGNTIRNAFYFYDITKDWNSASKNAHKMLGDKSAGNGSLMRCLPIAIYYQDKTKILDISALQSEMTHYDKIASDTCMFYNLIVFNYMNGADKIEGILNTNDKSSFKRRILRVEPHYDDYKKITEISKESLNPSGYVVDTLICALWCFLNTSTFEDAVCEAVNLGGDADTIGAITGGIAGVYYGYDAIPERWKDNILIKDEILSLANKLQ